MLLDPATGNNFFGRENILALLKKRADGLCFGYRQNVAIIGPSYYGKTSVLHRFVDTLQHADIVPVYVEVKRQGFEVFAQRFITALLFRYLEAVEYRAGDKGELVTFASERLPKTAKAVKAAEALIRSGKGIKALRAIFELPATAFAETGLRPIVILDEFHRMEDFAIENSFAELGQFIMLQKDTMYIVSSSQINQAKKILSEKLSLLFGNFEICELGTFDTKTAVEFVESRLGPAPLPKEYVEFLAAFTDGHPFYLDCILLGLRDRISEGADSDDTQTIAATFAELLFDSKGILNQHFSSIVTALEEKDRRSSAILTAIANGRRKVQHIAEASGLKAQELGEVLEVLTDLGLVAPHGAYHLIRDKVFELWLRNVYQSKEYLLDSGYEPKIARFNSEIKDFIRRSAETSRRDRSNLIGDVFTSFDGDLLEIGGKGFKLPRFASFQVRQARVEGISYVILSGEKTAWAVMLSLRQVRDSDVIDFIEHCRQYKWLRRKVIITEAEIQANAKLLAKEAKCWIWGLNDLNTLLDLAGKQKVTLPVIGGETDQGNCLTEMETA